METAAKRISYWDNAKGILMFLVVLAHYFNAGFIYSGTSGGAYAIPQGIISLIYMFHMPLFVFLSGYFSKKVQKARDTAFSQLFLPYLVFNTLCIVMDWLFWDEPLYNPVFSPYAHMWYLMALFLYRVFAPALNRLKWSWLWGLLFSLFCSLFTPGKSYPFLANCLTFLPFFLLGLETSQKAIAALRRIPKWLCAGVLVFALCGTIWAVHTGVEVYMLCFLTETYAHNFSSLPRIGITLLRYAAALLLGICVLNLVPERQSFLTKIGKNTMSILLLHQLPGFRNLLYTLDPFKDSLPLSMLWWTCWAVIMTFLLGTNRVTDIYQRLMDFFIKVIPKKATKSHTPSV